MPLPQSGKTYRIINAKTCGSLDLSSADNHTIACWNSHDGHNQRWVFEQRDGNRYTIRCGEPNKYLGLNGQVKDGTPVVGVDEPVEWDLWQDDKDSNAFRIHVPNHPTPINLDLSDNGNPAGGTKVTLWSKWDGKHQTWRFEELL